MKSTGVVRRVDELGRIILPIELRRTFEMSIKDPIEIYTEDDKIVLKKFQRTCVFCDSAEDLIDYKGKMVCKECLEELGR